MLRKRCFYVVEAMLFSRGAGALNREIADTWLTCPVTFGEKSGAAQAAVDPGEGKSVVYDEGYIAGTERIPE